MQSCDNFLPTWGQVFNVSIVVIAMYVAIFACQIN